MKYEVRTGTYYATFLSMRRVDYYFTFADGDIEIGSDDIEVTTDDLKEITFDELPETFRVFLKNIKFQKAMKDLLG